MIYKYSMKNENKMISVKNVISGVTVLSDLLSLFVFFVTIFGNSLPFPQLMLFLNDPLHNSAHLQVQA